MHRSRAPSIAPGIFFVAQPWADCITNMPGFNLRQAQASDLASVAQTYPKLERLLPQRTHTTFCKLRNFDDGRFRL
jgi:hypothetical protein